jgi:hypothetical protein
MTVEKVSIAVDHVGRVVADVVADPLKGEASVMHKADVGVPAFMQADRL